MFKSIGTIFILFTLVHLFGGAFASFEDALVATFAAVETAATSAERQLQAK